MKLADFKKGLLVIGKNRKFFGELVDVSTRGTVIVESYYDNHRHYINLRKVQPLAFVMKSSSKGFYASIPAIVSCYSWGLTEEEAYSNLKNAVRGYIRMMRRHHELTSWS